MEISKSKSSIVNTIKDISVKEVEKYNKNGYKIKVKTDEYDQVNIERFFKNIAKITTNYHHMSINVKSEDFLVHAKEICRMCEKRLGEDYKTEVVIDYVESYNESEPESESTPEYISALENEVLKPEEEKRDIFK